MRTCGDLVAVAAHRTLPELLLRVPETAQFRASERAKMLTDATLAHA